MTITKSIAVVSIVMAVGLVIAGAVTVFPTVNGNHVTFSVVPAVAHALGGDSGCCGGGSNSDHGGGGSNGGGGEHQLPPSCGISAHPTSIVKGQYATVTWSSSHATSAFLSGFGNVGVGGSVSVHPGETTTYALTVSGNGGSAHCSTTITVTQPPANPSCTISISPSTVSYGGSATLSWTSHNATSVSINQGVGSVGLNGSFAVSNLTSSKMYTMTATGQGGTVQCQTSVTVRNVVHPSCTISASPASITPDQNATISWSSSNAVSATLSTVGSVALNGSRTVSPNVTTTYILTVQSSNGEVDDCQTTIMVRSQQNLYCTISANPSSIQNGESSTLSWTSSSNVTSAELSGYGAVATNGSRTVSPDATHTYTLTVHDAYGRSENCQTTITVNNANAPYCTISISNYSYNYNNYNNQPAVLTWSSSNATSASISPDLGSVALSGSQTVYPHGSTTYVMTVTGPGGTNTCQTSVNPTSNLSCTITASPNSIVLGQSAYLNWSSQGAVSAWISDGVGNVSANGSITIRPSSSRNFTLTITDGAGRTQNCSTYITVGSVYVPPQPTLPYVSLTQIPYTGFDGNSIYFGSIIAFAGAAAYLLYYFRLRRFVA